MTLPTIPGPFNSWTDAELVSDLGTLMVYSLYGVWLLMRKGKPLTTKVTLKVPLNFLVTPLVSPVTTMARSKASFKGIQVIMLALVDKVVSILATSALRSA